MQRAQRIARHLEADLTPFLLSQHVDVIEVQNSVKIVLNRPKALNAVNLGMIEDIQRTLTKAKQDKKRLIVIRGAGSRAFCAGGDIRALADNAKAGTYEKCGTFFDTEFKLDCEIAELKEFHPEISYISLLDGITMGGGVGLSVHSKFIVATEKIKFAMPETGIGFFCDVGGSYFLSRLPGQLGLFVALTGFRLTISDVLYCGIASHFCPSDALDTLEECLLSSNGTLEAIEEVLKEMEQKYPRPSTVSSLEENRSDIDHCFAGNSVESIFESLKDLKTEWATKTLRTLSQKCPLSLKIEFECIRRGKSLSIREVMKMEYTVAMRCMQNPNFVEGVRAVIMDKDNKPKWIPATLEEISDTQTNAFFSDI